MTTVLIVNDFKPSIDLVAALLRKRGIEMTVGALTLDDARKKFAEHIATLKVVVMDGYVDKPLEHTLELMREMRQRTQAASRDIRFVGFSSDANDRLLAAGCERTFDPKNETIQLADYVASVT